jgi:hypothetical protein
MLMLVCLIVLPSIDVVGQTDKCGLVNYVLRGGELFNMVLLVPDDMPLDGANTLAGDVEEMRALYKDWGELDTGRIQTEGVC